MKKQLIASLSVATALVGTGVQADEFVPTTTPRPTTGTTEEKVQPVTAEAVDTAKAELDQASEAVADQEKVVATAEKAQAAAQAEVDTAKAEVTAAEELAAKATPEEIQSAEGKVTTAEEAVKQAETKLEVEKENQQVAQNKLDAQTQQVQTAQEAVDAKQEEVNQAQADVDTAQAILDGTNQSAIIKAADTAKTNLLNAEEVLTTAKAADQQRDQAIMQSQDTLTSAQAKQLEAQTAFDQASKFATQAEKALAEAQETFAKAENDKNSINTITLTPEYIRDLKEYIALGRSADRTAVESRLAAMAQSLKDSNVYKANPNDDKTTAYPVNDIPTEVLTEVSLFASELINQVRQQVGAPALTVVTPSSVAFADKATDHAVADNWNTWRQGHYNEGLTRVAKEYELELSHVVGNFYENWSGLIHDGNTVTLPQLKEHIHFAILHFLFADDEWDHAKAIAGLYYTGTPTAEYFAVDLSQLDGYTGIHFLGVEDTYLTDKSTNFDTTALPNRKSSTNIMQAYNNAQIALTTAQINHQTAQATKSSAQADLTTANNALTTAQANLRTAQQVPIQTPKAQAKRDELAAALVTAQLANDKAQELLANLSADVKIKQDNLAKAKSILNGKNAELATVQTLLSNEQTKAKDLSSALAIARAGVTQAENNLTATKAILKTSKDYLSALLSAPERLKQAKETLAKVSATAMTYRENLAIASRMLSELKAKEETATVTYVTLNSRYQDQLEKERQAKLKAEYEAITQKGGQPVPVVDGTGQVIGYQLAPKAPQATSAQSVTTTSTKALPNTAAKSSSLSVFVGLFLTVISLVGLRRKSN